MADQPPTLIINDLNEAIKYYEKGDWHRAASMLTEVYMRVSGPYRGLIDSLSSVLYNMEGALEDLNSYSRELFGEDCAKDNSRNEVLKCMVKVRDWFKERLRVSGLCTYDVKAPREYIEACKSTSDKLSKVGGEDVYVFASPNEVDAYWEGGFVGEIRRGEDGRLILTLAKTYMDDPKEIERLGNELGISLSNCERVSFGEEVMCEVNNEGDLAKALTYSAILDHTYNNPDLLIEYARKLELEEFKRLISGGGHG